MTEHRDKHPGGRPIEFDAAKREHLLALLTSGKSNRQACRETGICTGTLYRALSLDADFRTSYDDAKRGAVDALIDEADEIVDKALKADSGAAVAGANVAIKHLQWKAARLAPRRWGEKAEIQITTPVSEDPQDMAKRLAFLQALRLTGPLPPTLDLTAAIVDESESGGI